VLGPESGERPVEEKQSPHSGSKKGSSSTDHDGGSSSASAGKNGSEGERGNQLINCNRFTKARASDYPIYRDQQFFKIFIYLEKY